jgi:aldehyde:ferredoxin oxidoreductase
MVKADIGGYAGKILHIDLTSGRVKEEALKPELIKTFIGGYGISTKLAYDLIPPDVDPLAPENLIIIGTGPFAGTLVPGAAKLFITTKFPLNNAFATAAGGGHFAAMLKSNGYDYAIIGGQASHAVYLTITEEGAEIHDAKHLWGKDVFKTTDELRKIHEPCSIIPIGQAGENLVKISVAFIDKTGTIGCGGLPAVMGAKKLKAVVVQQGSKAVSVAHPQEFMRLVNNLHERMMKWPGREQMVKYGVGPEIAQVAPSEGYICDDWCGARAILDEKERAEIREVHARARKPLACPGCPIAEKEVVKLEEEGRTLITYLPHLRALRFDAKDMATELAKEAKYLDALGRYGLCYHDFRNVMTFAVHLYKAGIISKKDTGGIELKEDLETALKLMHMMVYRKGVGDSLAEGVVEAAQRINKGAEKYVVHVKGHGIVYDPRFRTLGTAEFDQIVTPRGSHISAGGSPTFTQGRTPEEFARHGERMGMPEEAVGQVIGKESFNVGRLTRYSEDWYSLFNCLSLCNRAWINRFYHVKTIAELYAAVTGIEVSPPDLMKMAERVWNLFKLLNVRAGFSRKDDKAPDVWFKPVKGKDKDYPLTDYYKTKVITEQDMESLLEDYYDERGWDKAIGIPTSEKLKELGLEMKKARPRRTTK